jgi:16S rRNA (uracil1498-N3)-methyltransferase
MSPVSMAWSAPGPLVFVSSIEFPVLESADHHHLAKARRLRRDEPLVVADGMGAWRVAQWDDGPVALGKIEHEPLPDPAISIAFAPVKGDRPDWMVAKLTELGVDRIIPLITERSIVRWDKKDDGGRARLDRAVREAAMQCKRARLPIIESPIALAQLAQREAVALASFDGSPISLAHSTLAIGPEGGWSPNELDIIKTHVSLGPTVLRAETAGLAAATLLGALRAKIIG